MREVVAALAIGLLTTSSALSKDIAICGASERYSYFPDVFGDGKARKWEQDRIREGRFTLKRVGNKFDLLFTNATGAITSAANDGGSVIQVGRNKEAIAVVVNYPGQMIETYTFIKSANGKEVIWSAISYGGVVRKVAAFRAACSFLDLE